MMLTTFKTILCKLKYGQPGRTQGKGTRVPWLPRHLQCATYCGHCHWVCFLFCLFWPVSNNLNKFMAGPPFPLRVARRSLVECCGGYGDLTFHREPTDRNHFKCFDTMKSVSSQSTMLRSLSQWYACWAYLCGFPAHLTNLCVSFKCHLWSRPHSSPMPPLVPCAAASSSILIQHCIIAKVLLHFV